MNARLEEHERALREGWLGELPLHDAHPVCSRHDDGGDDEAERVRMALFYSMGLVGPAAAACIERAHDHKGLLAVAMRGPLPEHCRLALRRAWEEVAGELPESVEFHIAGSPE